MRIPRDLSGRELAQKLSAFGYAATRQTGSHARFSTMQKGEHHVTIPMHDELRLGTLNAIISDIARHFEVPKSDIIDRLFG